MQNSPDKYAGPIQLFLRFFVRRMRMRWIRLRTSGKLNYGRNAYIAKNSEIFVPMAATIGDNVSVGSNFLSQTNFEIGDECLISSNVSFIGNDHDLYGGISAYFSGRLPPSKIVLEGDNFVGFGATILGNVRIGKGAIVAAEALVLRDVPPNTIVGGVPAIQLKSRIRL